MQLTQKQIKLISDLLELYYAVREDEHPTFCNCATCNRLVQVSSNNATTFDDLKHICGWSE